MNGRIKDKLFKLWIVISAVIVCAVILFIFTYILWHGLSSINLEFIFGAPKGSPLGSEGGIFPAIIGSLLLMILSCLFAAFLSIATAIYTVFYAKSKRLLNVIHMVIHCMAGIPSIILGMFGYTLLIVYLNISKSLLTASITLGLMIFPYIQVRVEKIFKEIDRAILNSSYALGVSKSYTIFRIILPIYRTDIISTILQAGGLAMGATAPIIATGAVMFAPIPNSLTSPIMALSFHLYILAGEGISLEKAYGTAAILIILLFVINIISLAISFKKKE